MDNVAADAAPGAAAAPATHGGEPGAPGLDMPGLEAPARFAASLALRLPGPYERAGFTRAERLVLRALFDQAGHVVTYVDLHAQWKPRGFLSGGHDDPEKGRRNAVRQMMARLRNKLRAGGLPAQRIETAAGLGYRWAGEAPMDAPAED
jgi:hypothetical protein